MQDNGTNVTMSHQCIDRFALTPEGVDNGRDRQHDRRGQHALGRARQHFGYRDEPDRAGRLHPVLDLAGETELLGHGQRDRLYALKHHRDPDDAGYEDGGER